MRLFAPRPKTRRANHGFRPSLGDSPQDRTLEPRFLAVSMFFRTTGLNELPWRLLSSVTWGDPPQSLATYHDTDSYTTKTLTAVVTPFPGMSRTFSNTNSVRNKVIDNPTGGATEVKIEVTHLSTQSISATGNFQSPIPNVSSYSRAYVDRNLNRAQWTVPSGASIKATFAVHYNGAPSAGQPYTSYPVLNFHSDQIYVSVNAWGGSGLRIYDATGSSAVLVYNDPNFATTSSAATDVSYVTTGGVDSTDGSYETVTYDSWLTTGFTTGFTGITSATYNEDFHWSLKLEFV